MAARAYVIVTGTITGQRYINKIQLNHVRIFLGAVDDKFIFMNDNEIRHPTLAA